MPEHLLPASSSMCYLGASWLRWHLRQTAHFITLLQTEKRVDSNLPSKERQPRPQAWLPCLCRSYSCQTLQQLRQTISPSQRRSTRATSSRTQSQSTTPVLRTRLTSRSTTPSTLTRQSSPAQQCRRPSPSPMPITCWETFASSQMLPQAYSLTI